MSVLPPSSGSQSKPYKGFTRRRCQVEYATCRSVLIERTSTRLHSVTTPQSPLWEIANSTQEAECCHCHRAHISAPAFNETVDCTKTVWGDDMSRGDMPIDASRPQTGTESLALRSADFCLRIHIPFTSVSARTQGSWWRWEVVN
jgi:hypothetical protein